MLNTMIRDVPCWKRIVITNITVVKKGGNDFSGKISRRVRRALVRFLIHLVLGRRSRVGDVGDEGFDVEEKKKSCRGNIRSSSRCNALLYCYRSHVFCFQCLYLYLYLCETNHSPQYLEL